MRNSTAFYFGIAALASLTDPVFAFSMGDSLKINATGSLQAGQIVRGHNATQSLSHKWLQAAFGNISLTCTPTAHTRMNLCLESSVEFPYIPDIAVGNVGTMLTRRPSYSGYVKNSEGMYTIGNVEYWSAWIAAGYFEYKYNPDARNLGEYLFRTRTYPQIIYNYFDFAMERLLGFRLGGTLKGGRFRSEVLLTGEVTRFPLRDYSVSYLAGLACLKNAFDLAGGIQFNRLFPVDGTFDPYKDSRNLVNQKAAAGIDTIPDSTAYYTSAGTKLMARLSFDPKKLWSSAESGCGILGSEDLKLYGELAVLGVKNYGYYYRDISKRIPIMIGFNFPSLKVLDVLALELEQFDSEYPCSDQQVYNLLAIPVYDKNNRVFRHDKLKWSVYMKRTFGSFALKAQFARDHMRPFNVNDQKPEYTDVLLNKEWWWMLKTEYGF